MGQEDQRAIDIREMFKVRGLLGVMERAIGVIRGARDLASLEFARGVIKATVDYLGAKLERAEPGITRFPSLPAPLAPLTAAENRELKAKLPHSAEFVGPDETIRVTVKVEPECDGTCMASYGDTVGCGNPEHLKARQIAEDVRLGRTSNQIRDEIIQKVGMMADARTPEMNARYDAALKRESKVDSMTGDGPIQNPQIMVTAHKRLLAWAIEHDSHGVSIDTLVFLPEGDEPEGDSSWRRMPWLDEP